MENSTSWTPEERKNYEIALANVTDKYAGHVKGFVDNFKSIRPGISGRPQFRRSDYEYFRPSEALPTKYKDMVIACDNMYHYFYLVRNVIDLMSDFACQGIKLVHPVKTTERFYNTWFKKVNGFDRSERFLNYLYRHSMVVVQARTGKLSRQVQEQFRSTAEDIEIEPVSVIFNEIPLQYIFHHPGLVEPKNNINSDKVTYTIQKTTSTKEFVSSMQNMGLDGKTIDLPPDKTFVFYFKRNDWDIKPIPFLYPLIRHAIMLNKLELADSAALDGAISAIRIFKLGSLEHKIAPSSEAVARLDEILQSNTSVGTLDLIWGPDIELIESNTNVHQFLGSEKYKPHLEPMYVGLGVPPSLAGQGGTGTTNNYISLKTLTKRLRYGRAKLIEFWQEQIKLVQRAMRFPKPAEIEFDFLELGDEEVEKRLLIDLMDRNVISEEKVQSLFGYNPDMEKARLNREGRERRTGRRVDRPSPFSDTFDDAIIKIALQRGYVTPEQAGVEISQETKGQKTPFQTQMDLMKQKATALPNTAKKAKGRPSGAKDKTKRKKAAFQPKIKAALDIWTANAQHQINDIMRADYLNIIGKSNFRQLTSIESQEYEKLLLGVLFQIKPFSNVTRSNVAEALEKGVSTNIFGEYLNYIKEVKEELGREPTLDETRKISCILYSAYKEI